MNYNKCISKTQGDAMVLMYDYFAEMTLNGNSFNSVFTVVVKFVRSSRISCLFHVCQDSCLLELHQSFGTDYVTVAAGHIRMQDLLERSQGRLHGTIQLTGTGTDFLNFFMFHAFASHLLNSLLF